MRIGNIIIHRASYIKKKLDNKPDLINDKFIWSYIYGLYKSRIIGLCIYRHTRFSELKKNLEPSRNDDLHHVKAEIERIRRNK